MNVTLLSKMNVNLQSDESPIIPLVFVCFAQEAKHQYWRQCVCVGQSVWISSLRVCSLQGLEGRRVLSDSCQSRLHPQESSEEPETHTDTSDAHLPSGSAPAVRVKRSTLISFKVCCTYISSITKPVQ